MKHHGAPEIIKRAGQLAPVTYIVRLQGTLAVALERYSMDIEQLPEVIIAEAIRAYLGDDQ